MTAQVARALVTCGRQQNCPKGITPPPDPRINVEVERDLLEVWQYSGTFVSTTAGVGISFGTNRSLRLTGDIETNVPSNPFVSVSARQEARLRHHEAGQWSLGCYQGKHPPWSKLIMEEICKYFKQELSGMPIRLQQRM